MTSETSSLINVLQEKLNQETAKIDWKSLQVYFAAGKLLEVSEQLDLLEASSAVALNKVNQVQQWMNQGLIGQVSNSLAKQRFEQDLSVWAVVVKPWILIQSLKPSDHLSV
ncbi:MAG: DUF2288 domain-containing protein [Pseudomonadota bacterium]